jgi:hypothetical protein
VSEGLSRTPGVYIAGDSTLKNRRTPGISALNLSKAGTLNVLTPTRC